MAQKDRTYRLLIVDDDETDRKLYGWLLARQAPGCFEIEAVASGAAGIAALRARRFDCVLLDFSLPDVTGLEFLSEAASGATTSNGELPSAVVLITGHGNEAIAVEAMKLGVQDYLVKDHVNEGRLWRAIVRAVSQRELRESLAESLRALTAANATLEQEAATRQATEAALRAAKDDAERAAEARTRFVATVTHELRTPLNGMLGHAELLRMEGGLSPQQNARIDAIMQSGRQLSGMVERVLDLANSAVTPAAQPRPSGKRVLLVDDIAMNREVLGAFLLAAGHEVKLAENGREAIEHASKQSFDLILMDVRMPEMDGLQATRRIRALPAPLGRVPILALTAYYFPDQIAQCREAGMDGHVAKPVDYATLIHAADEAMARRRPEQDNDGETQDAATLSPREMAGAGAAQTPER